jgi:IclR family transcriptional regulator, KDG regulon repressor
MSLPQTGGFYNRSLERALQILDSFSNDRKTLSRAQLSEILDLPQPTVSRLCSTLVRYGYLAKDPESKQYSLGIRLFEQGSIVFYSFSIRAAASRHLTELQKETGQTVFLGVLDNDELLYIDKREDKDNVIRFTSKIGTRRPPHWGMCGPLLMAHLSEAEIERLLEKNPLRAVTKKSLTRKQEFKAWLMRVREQGFAIDAEATFEGITGLAAPVRDFRGEVVASVGVAMMTVGVSPGDIEALSQKVIRTARVVSEELGCRFIP